MAATQFRPITYPRIDHDNKNIREKVTKYMYCGALL